MRTLLAATSLGGLLLCAPALGHDLSRFAGMAARSIGPAGMSGRVTAIDGVESSPETLYVGTATGGLWRTDDGALTWRALFDDQKVASIGAIAIHQKSPEIVWVGTGEGNPRNSASVGNGVYRTLDGGRTWTHLGLEGTEKIARILVHPDDPDVAWAAALGTSWGENSERGVFRTTDGGRTWERVLYVDERTGCADLALDPSNPKKLVAALWEHRREPWFFRSGGPGSGLYVSLDGGTTWTKRGTAEGLPGGELGRIGLAFCRTRPEVLYALVEAKTNALLRSDDGGASFRTVNPSNDVANRPFYYADIRVDPLDPQRVYNLGSVLEVSEDGGQTFRDVSDDVHPDHHALWIDPGDPAHVVDGNDGGLYVSRNRGRTWRFVRNLPLAQYYHIAVDHEEPYNVYGGMQDNGSWRGPNTVWENGGIRNHHWTEVGFGDGFATVPMSDDARRGYAMSQGGALMRFDLRTGERKGIQPDGPEEVELRFNWNAGIALDPFDPAVVYYGSQFLHRSPDRGNTWTTISPDLTTNNPAWQRQKESGGLTPDVTDAENYCTILTIAPSRLERGLVWVGTDDGRLQLTRDGGATWTSVEERLLGVPRNTWIPHVEASQHDPGTAYVVLDDHRRANWQPYVFVTRDHGATWSDLATADIWGYVHVIEEDPFDPSLLFLGTEFGLFVSRDAGASWARWSHGLPTCPVTALAVHPRDHDLVIGTFGRSAYVIDDLRPLRSAPEAEREAVLRVTDAPDAIAYRVAQTGESRFPGSEEFRGASEARGATISLVVAEAKELPKEATITILDHQGTALRRLRQDVQPGLVRVVWDLREHGYRGGGGRFGRRRGAGGGEGERGPTPTLELGGGPEVLPGTYTVRVELGEHAVEKPLVVRADPRVEQDLLARAARITAIRRAGALAERLSDVTERLARVRADLAYLEARAAEGADPDAPEGTDPPRKPLADAVEAFEKVLEEVELAIQGERDAKGIRRTETVSSEVRGLAFGLGSSWDAPTPGELRSIDEGERALKEGVEKVNAALAGEAFQALQKALAESDVKLLGFGDPLSVD